MDREDAVLSEHPVALFLKIIAVVYSLSGIVRSLFTLSVIYFVPSRKPALPKRRLLGKKKKYASRSQSYPRPRRDRESDYFLFKKRSATAERSEAGDSSNVVFRDPFSTPSRTPNSMKVTFCDPLFTPDRVKHRATTMPPSPSCMYIGPSPHETERITSRVTVSPEIASPFVIAEDILVERSGY